MKKTFSFVRVAKKKALCLVLAVFSNVICPIKAQDYSLKQLRSLSDNYFQITQETSGKTKKSKVKTSVKVDTLYLGNKPKMFLCQYEKNWVIFANEQSVEPIVCLGEGNIDVKELKKTPLWFLLTESMMGLDSLRISGVKNVKIQKKMITIAKKSKQAPLLDQREINKWDQAYNNTYEYSNDTYNSNKIYNKYCPSFYKLADGKTFVGCTAVAMAQVMWYHRWPSAAQIPNKINAAGTTYGGKSKHSYNWSNMPGAIYDVTKMEQVNAVAGLLRDCGYAGGMIYGPCGSSMTLTNARKAFRNTFGYNANLTQYSSGPNRFNTIIKSEIAAKRPVIIQATHKWDGTSHSYVIDGYDSSSDMYHINMGWGCGHSCKNTWYSVSGSNCYANYTVARRMLHEIIPQRKTKKSYLEKFKTGISKIARFFYRDAE